MNHFGEQFRLEIWGASHTPRLGVRIDGVPAGVSLSAEDLEIDLSRRRAGGVGTTARHEADIPTFVSGVEHGVTTGKTIEISFANTDTRSADYDRFRTCPRPSHVDFVARARYGTQIDLRGSGMFSGRMTLPLVAAGAVAKRVCPELKFSTSIIEIGGSRKQSEFMDIIAAARAEGDSVGGVVECRVNGVGIGIGEPFFDSTESIISHLLFSIPAVKGVEFGSGFEGVRLRGSERNDRFADAAGYTVTNNEGGIVGGLTNGNELVVRVAVKPTPSISRPQQTFDMGEGQMTTLQIGGRHDACIALRAAVVVESVVAIALADLTLRQK